MPVSYFAPDGTWHLVFGEQDSTGSWVSHARSLDRGENWSPSKRLPVPDSIAHHFMPWFAVDQSTGALHVIAYGQTESLRTQAWAHRSDDGGKTWTKVNTGLPSEELGRIGLSIAKSNPDIVYANVEAANRKGGIYRSSDNGVTWEKRSDYNQGSMYYGDIFADESDADRVYVPDVLFQVAGKTGRPGQWIVQLTAIQDRAEAANVLVMLDELAELWGDEGKFRACRDRLRKMLGGTPE